MAQPFTCETAVAAPLLRDNVDTDAIIPSREMRSVGKQGLAEGLFAGWRYTAIGGREADPAFVLNQPRYSSPRFLVSGENFGCGSSREHAAWALGEYGFHAVIARSFNPIFFGNCVRNGIVPVTLAEDEVVELVAWLETAETPELTVDLRACEVRAGEATYAFRLGAEERDMLLEGLDPVALTLRHADTIAAFREADRKVRPWAYF
jgi:3-isopropylmalate/(R)-2-methylmalate dehydratase small subunit